MKHSDHWIVTGWHGEQWGFQNNEKTMKHSDHWTMTGWHYRVYKKNATSEFPKKSTLQFLSIKDFRPLGIEIELLIDHISLHLTRPLII
jgi:hypothetical protein